MSYSIIREKGQNFFSLERLPFFQKFVFNNLLDFLKFDLITSAVKLKLPRGLLQSVLWDLHTRKLDYMRKKDQNLFFTRKIAFSSKFCVFKQPPRCYRIDLISSTVIVGLPFGPLPIVFWGLSHSIIREKTGQTFVTGQKAFFEMFGSQILRS